MLLSCSFVTTMFDIAFDSVSCSRPTRSFGIFNCSISITLCAGWALSAKSKSFLEWNNSIPVCVIHHHHLTCCAHQCELNLVHFVAFTFLLTFHANLVPTHHATARVVSLLRQVAAIQHANNATRWQYPPFLPRTTTLY